MATPKGASVGRVSVKVVPDTSGFHAELRAQLASLRDNFKVQLGLDSSRLQSQFRTVKERIERNTIEANVRLDVDRRALDRLSTANILGGGGFSRGGGAGLSGIFGSILRSATALTGGLIKLTSGFGGLFQATSKVGDVSSLVSRSFSTMAAGLAAAAAGAAGLVVMLGIASIAIAAIAGLLAIIGGLVGTAIGALVAGLVGLPVVLTAVAGGLGTVALGMDGIKAAAESLRPEFDRLKASISTTFEQGLTPVFERLRGLFPVLQDGLNGIAESIVQAAGGLADMAMAEENIQNLRNAFEGIRLTMQGMAPGLGALFQSLMDIAGTEANYRILGATVSTVAQKFADFAGELNSSGDLTRALGTLQLLINSVVDVLISMAQAATEFMIGAGPGVAAFFESLADTIGRMDWEYLGETFGEMFTKMANALDEIPQESLDKLVQSIGNIATKVAEFAEKGGFEKIVNGLASLGFAIELFMIIGQNLLDFFYDLTANKIPALVGALPGVGPVFDLMAIDVGEATNKADASVKKNFDSMKQNVSGSSNAIVESARKMADSVGWEATRAGNEAAAGMSHGMGNMTRAVTDGKNNSAREASGIPDAVLNSMGPLTGTLLGAGQSLINGFIRGIRSMIGSVRSAASAVVSAARAFFPFSPAKTGPFSGRGYTSYSGRALAEDWARGIEEGTPAAIAAVERMMSSTSASASWSGHISSDSYGLSDSVYSGVMAAFNGSRLQVDGNGLAKLVNTTNARNSRR